MLPDQSWREQRCASAEGPRGRRLATRPGGDEADWRADSNADHIDAVHNASAGDASADRGCGTGSGLARVLDSRIGMHPHWLLRSAILLAVLRPAVSLTTDALNDSNDIDIVGGYMPFNATRGTVTPETSTALDPCLRGACVTPPGWATSDPGGKAEQVLAFLLREADDSMSDALNRLHGCQKWLARHWATATDAAARRTAWASAPSATRQALGALASLTAEIESQSDLSFVDALAHGQAIFSNTTLPDGGVEAVYFRELWPGVDEWARADALPALFASPINYLRLAYTRHHKQLAHALADDYSQRQPFDRRALELAAVLYAKASPGTIPGYIARDFDAFVCHFAQAVAQDSRWRHAGAQVLPTTLLGPPDRSVWFDGTALRGASGLDLRKLTARLVQDRQLRDARSAAIAFHEALGAFPPATMPDLIRDRLTVLVENADYPFGTPYQSLATVLMRLGPMHNVSTTDVGKPAALLERFEALEAAWQQAPRYPVAPHLAAAFHLGRSSDVLILDERPVEAQLIERVRERYVSELEKHQANETVGAWLARHDLSLWGDLPRIVQSPALPEAPTVLREVAGEYLRLERLPERMIVADLESGVRQLVGYLGERLLAYADPGTSMAHGVNGTDTSGEIRAPGGTAVAAATTEAVAETTSVTRAETATASTVRAEILRAQAKERLRLRGKAPTPEAIAQDQARLAEAESARGTVAQLGSSRLVVDRLLVSASMILQAENPEATLLDFVPFVGSTYQFGKGLIERDSQKAVRGAFGFGLDAMFCWLGGVGGQFVERRIMREAGEVMLADHEARALTMLTDFGRQMGSPPPGALPLDRVSVNPDPFGVLQEDASVPVEHRAAAAAARRGAAATVTMANGSPARLIHSPARGVVTPVRLDGRRWVELDWRGHVVEELDFAYGDDTDVVRPEASDQQTRADTSAVVAPASEPDLLARRLPRAFPTASFPEVLDPAFSRRPTVQAVENLFADLQIADPLRAAPQVSAFLAASADAPALIAGQGRDIVAALQSLCDASPTMQALLRRALKKMPGGAPRVELQIVTGARPVCDIAGRIIRLPPLNEIPSNSYVDMQGATPFQPRRAWLHELVHAMTKLRDVGAEEGMEHRGPVVYLTDRILFEAGHNLRERIMYQPAPRTASPGRAHLIERQIAQARSRCVYQMITEDAYLDAVLQERQPESLPYRILNVAISRRITVTQARALASEVVRARDTLAVPKRTFYDRMVNLWLVQIDRDFGLSVDWAENFRDYGNSFYMNDEIFRHLAERWLIGNGSQSWRLLLASRGQARVPANVGWSINRATRSLTLYRDPLYYQSLSGPCELELKRRIAGALLDLMLPHRVDFSHAGQAAENRGLRVYLENRLLAGNSRYPRRVSGQLAEDRESLLPFAIKARRAADAEDIFLGPDILDTDD